MDVRTLAMVVVSMLAVVACGRPAPVQPATTTAAETASIARPAPAETTPSFVNKVWRVAESRQVAQGETRIFLADGTLVMASPHAKPAYGAWRYDDGQLTITEEGQDYPTDILTLSESAFRIRMHSPGEPVEMLLEPAEQLPMAAIAEARQATAAMQAEVEPTAIPLWGTAWRLESIAGVDVPDDSQATLEFPSESRASGKGSCNRFNGVVVVEGNMIQFGGLAATRMACAAAVMRQEDTYFAALRDAERFVMEGETLLIYAASRSEPLRLAALQKTAERPVQSIERVNATEMPALTGIWTVVAHYIPGVSAMSDGEARTHYGETLRLTDRSAISPGSSCREPRYASNRVSTEQYLAGEYKLQPGSLKPLAAQVQVQLMKVSCGGAPWNALGATLLGINADRVLAPWDGVFFELVRDHDFRALGQEPGWELEIHKGAEMRLNYDYSKSTAVTPASRAQVDARTGTRTYHAVTKTDDLRVEIVPVACTDSMSGKEFPATVSVTLNGRIFRGCGGELEMPYQG